MSPSKRSWGTETVNEIRLDTFRTQSQLKGKIKKLDVVCKSIVSIWRFSCKDVGQSQWMATVITILGNIQHMRLLLVLPIVRKLITATFRKCSPHENMQFMSYLFLCGLEFLIESILKIMIEGRLNAMKMEFSLPGLVKNLNFQYGGGKPFTILQRLVPRTLTESQRSGWIL